MDLVSAAGNVSIAVLAGAVGWWFSQSAVFYLVPIFSLLAAAAVLSIPARAIDHAPERERAYVRRAYVLREHLDSPAEAARVMDRLVKRVGTAAGSP